MSEFKFKIGKTVEKVEKTVAPFSDVISICIDTLPEGTKDKTNLTLSIPALDAMGLRKLERDQVNNLSYANLEDGIFNTYFFNFKQEGSVKETIGINMNGSGSNKVLITDLRECIEKELGVLSSDKIYLTLAPSGEHSGFELFKVVKVAQSSNINSFWDDSITEEPSEISTEE